MNQAQVSNKSLCLYIVTPCFNECDTIESTIQSIFSQKGKFCVNYHIQDGGSTDGTLHILEKWKEVIDSGKYQIFCDHINFSWDSRRNTGKFAAISQGFDKLASAPEDFMTWVNAGDTLMPNALERVARVAKNRQDVDWLSGACHVVDSNKNVTKYEYFSQIPPNFVAAGLCDGIHWPLLQQKGMFWRQKLYDLVGGIDTNFHHAGDWDLWRRFAQKTHRYELPLSLTAFRCRENSSLHDQQYREEIDKIISVHEREKTYEKLFCFFPSYLTSIIGDPLEGNFDIISTKGNYAKKAEVWRMQNCPDMDWPRITVVTPSYNQGLFLDSCMRSVLDQGYPNLEYIVMDGGSVDNSLSVIRSHSHHLSYWQSCPDGGQYQAIQDGLNRGTGEIMAWLNADDLYVGPCLFKIAMLFMLSKETDWLTGRPTVADQRGKLGLINRDLCWSRGAIMDMSAPLTGLFLGQDAVFWRRTLWEKAGSHLNHNYPLAADYELWLRFSRFTELKTVQDIFSAFRHHGDQKSLTQKKDYLLEMCEAVDNEINIHDRWNKDLAIFATPPVIPPLYANTFGVLKANSEANEIPIINVGSTLKNIDSLKSNIENAREKIVKLRAYQEAVHLDDSILVLRIQDQLKNIKCLSFDCFDTVLYRACDEPTKLFIQVGRTLREKNELVEHISPEAFKTLRETAEKKARKRSFEIRGTIECSLEEIYDQMQAIITHPSVGVQIELEMEKKICFPNPAILNLMNHFSELGIKIAILSDSYLSSRQLVALLKHNGVDLNIVNLVLTSHDAKAGKYDGTLFSVAASRLNIKLKEMLHVGDNAEVDVLGAQRVGVQAFLYARQDDYTQDIQEKERSLYNTTRHVGSLSPFRVLARRFGAQVYERWRGYYQDGAFLFGPVLARYADWVVSQCRKENIRNCLVFMREAQTLLPLIKRSAEVAAYDIDVKPFYVSRHSVNLASLIEVSAQSIYDKSGKRRKPTPRILLESFGITPAYVKEIDDSSLDSPLNDSDRAKFSVFIANHPVYSKLLRTKAKHDRFSFLQYALPRFGNQKKIAIADLGFKGSTQMSMDRIFKHENLNLHMVGLYFCTRRNSSEVILQGSDMRSYLGDIGAWHHEMHCLYKHPEILEQSVNAVCGTTMGYDKNNNGEYVPVVENVDIPFEQIYKRWLIQLGIFSFQKLWLDFRKNKIFLDQESTDAYKIFDFEVDMEAVYIMQRLFSFPTKNEALRFGSLYHDDNNGTNLGNIICDDKARLRFREGGLGKMNDELVYWPQGVVAIESQTVFDQMFAIKKCFQSL